MKKSIFIFITIFMLMFGMTTNVFAADRYFDGRAQFSHVVYTSSNGYVVPWYITYSAGMHEAMNYFGNYGLYFYRDQWNIFQSYSQVPFKSSVQSASRMVSNGSYGYWHSWIRTYGHVLISPGWGEWEYYNNDDHYLYLPYNNWEQVNTQFYSPDILQIIVNDYWVLDLI